MEIDPTNNEVLQLLRKLKDSNGTYPQELLAVRRQGYLKQVAQIAGGAGLAMGLRNTVKNARGASGLPAAAGTLLEGLLVVAIVVEASTVAYFYRDQVARYFQKLTNQPKVEEVISPPVVSSPLPTLQVTPSPLVTEAVTETETPGLTPTLQLAAQPTNPSSPSTGQGSGEGGGSQPVSTSAPSDGSSSNENNGNHYGQTPIPERTKDPVGNDNNNDVSSQDTQTNPSRRNK